MEEILAASTFTTQPHPHHLFNSPPAMKPQTIDEYISGFAPEVQARLQELRRCIQQAAPQAVETIGYQMPAFKMKTHLVYFAANKNHIGFYPTSGPMQAFAAELQPYQHSKGAIQFPYSQPLPLDLVARITQYRVAQDSQKAAPKPPRQPKPAARKPDLPG